MAILPRTLAAFLEERRNLKTDFPFGTPRRVMLPRRRDFTFRKWSPVLKCKRGLLQPLFGTAAVSKAGTFSLGRLLPPQPPLSHPSQTFLTAPMHLQWLLRVFHKAQITQTDLLRNPIVVPLDGIESLPINSVRTVDAAGCTWTRSYSHATG